MSAKPGPFSIGPSLQEALALQRQGRLREAEKIYARVLKAAPDNFDALNLLGTVKAQLGRLGEAERLLRAAVAVNPRVAEAWGNLGQALYAQRQSEAALACFDKALALAPADAGIRNNRANALLSLGRPAEALAEFQRTLAQVPHHADAWVNSGIAHAAMGAPEDAIAAFDRALALAPNHAAAHYNRGRALIDLGRHDEAVAANDRVLALAPGHAGAWLNRGRALAALNRPDEAVASYDKAIALDKDHADAHFNAALARLALGDYRRGFAQYEWRWRRTGMPAAQRRSRPLWLGEYLLARKTILVHAEQGLGDTIQFARYVPLLASSGAKVVLEVQPELVALMARLDGAASVLARGAAPPPFDAHCPLGSLPLAFKTVPETVPAGVPYLSAAADRAAKWSAQLNALDRPRVALAWSGNPSHPNDRNRSIPFARLAPLFSGAARFVGVQRDPRSDDATALAGEVRVMQVSAALDDFADTAAVLANVDLVIAVDTAVAHLAGAMGRPVWVLVPFAPDWRWTLHGDTTPWYPTARVFRQTSPGDWDDVVARVAAALAQLAAA